MKNVVKIVIFLSCLQYTREILAELIVSAAEGIHGAQYPFELAFNIGPAWYATNGGLFTKKIDSDSIFSVFKTNTEIFAAFAFEGTVEPHKNCFFNINIGGGLLRGGTSFFIDYDKICSRIVSKNKTCFDGNLFNINITGGLMHPVHQHITLETALGYSYDYGKLIFPNSTITYDTVGPVLSLGFTAEKNKFSFNATYSCIPGSYKELDKKEDITLLLRFPKTITNHIDIVTQYALTPTKTIGILFSYDYFKNIGSGPAQPLCSNTLNQYTFVYDKLRIIALMAFASISF